jgi:hypothetical protein
MAKGPTRTDVPPGPQRTGSGERLEARLAELVAELASCDQEVALDAVRSGADVADPLELVARAMTGIRHRELEPQDRLRVAGFLRAEHAPLPRRNPGATALAEREQADHRPVHHGSLRRWERTDAAGVEWDADDGVGPEDGVIDLRDRTARFRRPGHG